MKRYYSFLLISMLMFGIVVTNAQVHIGNISDGSNSALLTQPRWVAISGNYAYVASYGDNGLQIINCSIPGQPFLAGNVANGDGGALLGGAFSVAVSGNYAYIASQTSHALEIVDVTDKNHPIHKGSISNGQDGAILLSPNSVFVSGIYAYVTSNSGLEIVDIHDPTHPTHTGKISNGEGGGTGALLSYPRSVYVVGNYAYVVSLRALEIVDVSDRAHPLHKGSLADATIPGTFHPLTTSLYSPSCIIVSGSYAYITDAGWYDDSYHQSEGALEIVDISNPASPAHKGKFESLNLPQSVALYSHYAYVVSSADDNLEIIDVADPVHPTLSYNLTGNGLDGACSIAIAGTSAYITSVNSNDIAILDITNPIRPVDNGAWTDNQSSAHLQSPKSAYVSGNYAFVTSSYVDASSGQSKQALEIVDITNPSLPVHKGSVPDGSGGAKLSGAAGVYVQGNYAYVASRESNALEIVDISQPARPVHKGSIDSWSPGGPKLNQPTAVFVSGAYAYVTSSNALEIVDVTNPAAPVHKGSIVDGAGGAKLNGPRSLYVLGNYAYIASILSNAMEIVDVTNRAAPVHKGSILNGTGGALLSNPTSVYIQGFYAYVTSTHAGTGTNALEIIDIHNPASPTHLGNIIDGQGGAVLGTPQSVYVSGFYAYVASWGSSAIEVIDISTPENPFHKGSISDGAGGALLGYTTCITGPGNFGTYFYATSQSKNALEIIRFLPITIASFSPSSGTAGTSVTITGANFSTTPGNNIVTFNGIAATVTASTATTITVTVPAGAANGPIVVSQVGQTQTAKTNTNFLLPPTLTITSSSSGACGTAILLSASSGGSTGTITYSVVNGTGTATIPTTGVLVLNTVGTVTVTASITADARFTAGTTTQIITITQGTPVILFTSASSGSPGAAISLTVSKGASTGAVSYSEANGTGAATLTGNTLTLGTIGSVTVTANVAADANYAAGTASQTITIVCPPAIITPGGTTNFCLGSSVTLTANLNTSYLWSNGATTRSISVSSAGDYTVTVTSYGCSTTSAPTTVTTYHPSFIEIDVDGIVYNRFCTDFSQHYGIGTHTVSATPSTGISFSLWDPQAAVLTHSVSGNTYTFNTKTTTKTFQISISATSGGCPISACVWFSNTDGGSGPGGGGGEERVMTQNPKQDGNPDELSYYPNPADKGITVTIPSPASQESPIHLYDLSGKVALKSSFHEGEQEKLISTEALAPGLYLLRVTSGSKEQYVKVVIRRD